MHTGHPRRIPSVGSAQSASSLLSLNDGVSMKRKAGGTYRREPQQRRARETVEAVLDAVVGILKRGGIEAVTINRVAEVAGVSIGSVYQYFSDKRAIFAALHVRGRGGPQLRITDCRRPHNPELLTFYGVAAKSSATTRASMPHTGKRD